MRSDRRRRKVLRRALRVVLVLGLGVFVLAGGYVGYVTVRHTRPVVLPAPTGRYKVGRTSFDWTDQSRTDPLAPQAGRARELSVWLWYPAPPGTTGKPAPYLPGLWANLHLPGLPGLGETSFAAVHDHALVAAPAADGRFPAVVLEPGMGFAAPQYATIAEDLASHGYIVAGVTPTYSANLSVVGSKPVHASHAGNPGQFDTNDPHTGAPQQAGDRLVGIWSADARFTAAQVAKLDQTGPFAGHINADHTVYIGHSLGGAAALQACHDDPRCAGAANLDGTQYGPVVHTGLRQPTLTIESQDSCVTGTCSSPTAAERSDRTTARALLAASTGTAWCYQITGARHFNFSDYATYYLAAPIRALLALGPIDGDRGLAITDTYLTAFVDHVLHEPNQPHSTKPDPRYPEVRVQHCRP